MNLILDENQKVIAIYPGYESHKHLHEGNSEMFVLEGTPLTLSSEGLGWQKPKVVEDFLWQAVRKRRDLLLSQSDWTQLIDVNLEGVLREQYQVYRERLRTVPQVFDLAEKVIWPELGKGWVR